MPDSFSQRHGHAGPPPGTLYRDHVPISFRALLLEYPNRRDHEPVTHAMMQKVIVELFQVWPSGHSYTDCEKYLKECEWFRILDIVEGLYRKLGEKYVPHQMPPSLGFRIEINKAFIGHNMGWQIDNSGQIIVRADEAFEQTIKAAGETLNAQKLLTGADHLHHAIKALSGRPQPNTAGAVAHATSAVECVLGVVTGQPGLTFGAYLKKHPSLFHGGLAKGLSSIYGYASDEGARHGKEGTQPTPEDAEFVVATCAAVCTLLTRKHRPDKP